MLKSFAAAALVAAMAESRGSGDGSSADNAFTTSLFNENGIAMDMHTWNQFSSTSNSWQLYADVDLSLQEAFEVLVGGLCIQNLQNVTEYDCLSLKIFIDLSPNPNAIANQVTLVDHYHDAQNINIKIDSSAETTKANPNIGWMENSARS